MFLTTLRNIKLKIYFVVLVLCLPFCLLSESNAGELDDFEQDATSSSDSNDDNYSDDSIYDTDYDDYDSRSSRSRACGGFRCRSVKRKRPNNFSTRSRKRDILMPAFRLDAAQGSVNDGISLRDIRLESGVEFLAVNYRYTGFIEEAIDDEMRVRNISINFRIINSRVFEVTGGMGRYQLVGNKRHSAASLQFGALYQASNGFKFEFRIVDTLEGSDNLDLTDIEFSAYYGIEYASIKVGIRNLSNPKSSMQGPFVGLSFYY